MTVYLWFKTYMNSKLSLVGDMQNLTVLKTPRNQKIIIKQTSGWCSNQIPRGKQTKLFGQQSDESAEHLKKTHSESITPPLNEERKTRCCQDHGRNLLDIRLWQNDHKYIETPSMGRCPSAVPKTQQPPQPSDNWSTHSHVHDDFIFSMRIMELLFHSECFGTARRDLLLIGDGMETKITWVPKKGRFPLNSEGCDGYFPRESRHFERTKRQPCALPSLEMPTISLVVAGAALIHRWCWFESRASSTAATTRGENSTNGVRRHIGCSIQWSSEGRHG